MASNKKEKISYPPIVLPYGPESINSVMNYGRDKGELNILKHKWQDLASIYIQEAIRQGFIPAVLNGKAHFTFKMYFENQRKRDEDNYFLIAKGIIDEFVKQNVIEDDSSEYAHFSGIYLMCDKQRPRVEIWLKEVLRKDQIVNINYVGPEQRCELTGPEGVGPRLDSLASREACRALEVAGLCSGDSEDSGDAESVATIAPDDLPEVSHLAEPPIALEDGR